MFYFIIIIIVSLCRNGSVKADVKNFFSISSSVTKTDVESAIDASIQAGDGIFSGATVTCMSASLSVYIPMFINNYQLPLLFSY